MIKSALKGVAIVLGVVAAFFLSPLLLVGYVTIASAMPVVGLMIGTLLSLGGFEIIRRYGDPRGPDGDPGLPVGIYGPDAWREE